MWAWVTGCKLSSNDSAFLLYTVHNVSESDINLLFLTSMVHLEISKAITESKQSLQCALPPFTSPLRSSPVGAAVWRWNWSCDGEAELHAGHRTPPCNAIIKAGSVEREEILVKKSKQALALTLRPSFTFWAFFIFFIFLFVARATHGWRRKSGHTHTHKQLSPQQLAPQTHTAGVKNSSLDY